MQHLVKMSCYIQDHPQCILKDLMLEENTLGNL